MGYRSEVAIAMHKNDYDNMLIKANKAANETEKLKYLPTLLDDATKTSISITEKDETVNTYVILYWSWVKWYNGGVNPAVTWIMENLPPIHKYIRIGENDDDNEIMYRESDNKGNFDDNIYDIISFNREIRYGLGNEKFE